MLSEDEIRGIIEQKGYISKGECFRGELASLEPPYFRFSIRENREYAFCTDSGVEIITGEDLFKRAQNQRGKLFSIIKDIVKKQEVEVR